MKSPMQKVLYGKAKKGTFKRLLGAVIQEHKGIFILVLISMTLATIANVGAIYMVQYVIKEAVHMVEIGSTDFSLVIRYVLSMIMLYVVNISFTYIYLRMMVTVSQSTLLYFRNKLFTHMLTLPLQYFDTHRHGELMSLYTNDIDATRQMISQSLPQIFVSGLTLIGYLAAMFVTSYQLSIVTLVFTAMLFLIVRKIAKRSKKYFNNQQQSIGKVNGYIEEMIEGQKVIKVFRHEKEAIAGFEILNENLYHNAQKASQHSGVLIPITVNVGYLGFAITAILGAYLITKGLMVIPGLVAFLLFTRNYTSPINQLSQQVNFVQMALAGASRIFDVLDESSEVDEGKVTLTYAKKVNENWVSANEYTGHWGWKVPGKDDLIPLKGDVRFEHVNFGYLPDKLILKDVSLFAKPGQKIAFVGATGAGKTTITNLINRFYDISSGSITYDGIDIKDIKKDDLRRSLGVVLQDTHLFTTTIMENIRYGNLMITDDEVIESAKRANAHDFIMKLPEGYQTILTDDGMNLSQGQRQLLSIARAVAANPPVLILDEATSSVDTYTEKLIQKGMDELMRGRTVFVIAHQLATIKNAKAIIVLDEGEIIERGNHDDLVSSKGRYYQLYTGAFELE